MTYLATLINGLSLGSVYALIALGYTMVYGIAKMLNFAHGEIIMAGAYAALVTVTKITDSFLLAILVAAVVCVLLGVTVEKIAYRPLRGASPLAVLITAIGVSYFLQSLAQIIFGSKPISVNLLELNPIKIGTLTIKAEALITLGVSAVCMTALTCFVSGTKTGRSMLAVSEDRAAAELMGVDVEKTITLTFAIGSALAAVAGVFYLLQIPLVQPTMGAMPGIKAFVAAVLGGIGSIPGAMLGGILLGVTEQFAQSSPAIAPYSDAIVFSILIVVLLLRPTGFFGKKRIEKV